MIMVICPCCRGTGWLVTHNDDLSVIHRDPCTHCRGTGEVPSELDKKPEQD
jgi:hypothetical protein